MRNTAKLHAYGSALLHYDEGAIRSTDDGVTWSAVTSLTGTVTSMATGVNRLVAITLVSPTAPQQVMGSTDGGATWSVIGSVTVRNNGVVHELVSANGMLYGVSNRDEVFVSTDDGTTWTTRTYTASQNESAVDGTFNAEGWWVLSTSGLYRSTDDGSTWEKQGTAQGLTANPVQIETVNGTLLGLGLFGILRWDPNADRWTDVSQTLPEFATLKAQIRDVRGDGAVMYAVGNTFDGASFAVASMDNGSTWERVGEPLPNANGVTRRALAITERNIVVYHNGVGAAAAFNGYYRNPRITTSVDMTDVQQLDMTVAPRPATTTVTVTLPMESYAEEFIVMDVQGSVVTIVPAQGPVTVIDVSRLATGSYMITTKDGRRSARLPVVR
jgi:photosystem II stability/assembly factor-like uncharacterized protein